MNYYSESYIIYMLGNEKQNYKYLIHNFILRQCILTRSPFKIICMNLST